MKNRIMIVGNEKFAREEYVDGEYKVLPKKSFLDAIYDTYEVDNLSNSNLTSDKAIRIAGSFVNKYEYNLCIISFGIKEIEQNSIEKFENNLQNLINMLIFNGVMPILMDIEPCGNKNLDFYNDVIEKLRKTNNVEKKFYGDCLNFVNA